jgi:hypothetical protein
MIVHQDYRAILPLNFNFKWPPSAYVGLGGWPPRFEPAVAVHSSVEWIWGITLKHHEDQRGSLCPNFLVTC